MNPFLRMEVFHDLPSMDDAKRDLVEAALIRHKGNKTHAARTLGISIRGMRYLLRRHGLEQWLGDHREDRDHGLD